MPLDPSHPDYWTEVLQFTRVVHRDVYPLVEPSTSRMREIAENKVVIVTGAGSGFGKGACEQWAIAGAKAIVLAGRNQTAIDDVALSLSVSTPTVKTLAIATDVSSANQTGELFRRAQDAFGDVHVVVHCAGVLGPIANLGDAPVEAWWTAFEINTKGTFLVAKNLVQAARGRPVSFIHAGTAASYFASPGQSSYTAAKAADNMILDQIHAEYSNVRAFNVHPGMALSSVLRKELQLYAKDTPKLFGSLTVYLVGQDADYLRGRFVASNWDLSNLKEHEEQIVAEGLLKNQPFKGTTGPGGHHFNRER